MKGYNCMRYAISDNPLGPWKYMGVYMEPSDCFTNQGSIVEYKGEWFAFYHTISLSNNPALRSICADKLYHNEDGTIRMVKQQCTLLPCKSVHSYTTKVYTYVIQECTPL